MTDVSKDENRGHGLNDLFADLSVNPLERQIELPDLGERQTESLYLRLPTLIKDFCSSLTDGMTLNGGFQDGALLDLRGESAMGKEIILVGDLHGLLRNLHSILDESDARAKLSRDELILVFLGDIVHEESAENLGAMESSAQMLLEIMQLKIEFPKLVHWLWGNHDFLEQNQMKLGVPQPAMFKSFLEKKMGEEFVADYKRAASLGAVAVVGPVFAAAHAGPVTHVTNLDDIREFRISDSPLGIDDPILYSATKSRYSRGDFGPGDINRFLNLCEEPRGVFYAGHAPQSAEGSHWEIAPNFHILYAANKRPGYLSLKEGKRNFIELEQPMEPIGLAMFHISAADLTELSKSKPFSLPPGYSSLVELPYGSALIVRLGDSKLGNDTIKIKALDSEGTYLVQDSSGSIGEAIRWRGFQMVIGKFPKLTLSGCLSDAVSNFHTILRVSDQGDLVLMACEESEGIHIYQS